MNLHDNENGEFGFSGGMRVDGVYGGGIVYGYIEKACCCIITEGLQR